MTRETAINKLNWALDNNTIEDVQSAYEYIIALKMAIKALEQEPRKGHWIEHEQNGIAHIECSECLTWFLRCHFTRNSFCPNCGAKMIDPQSN